MAAVTMAAGQKKHWNLLVLINLLPLLKEVATQSEAVAMVNMGGGVVLECVCPWQGQLTMVSWVRLPDLIPLLVFHPELGTEVLPPWAGRVKMLRRTSLDASVALANVSLEDEARYRCSIHTFPRGSWSQQLELQLHPESSPEADVHLTTEKSSNLTISCHHDHNGVYLATLEKLGAGVGMVARCRMVGRTGIPHDDFVHRGQSTLSCSDRLELSLHLTQLDQEDSGFYRCHFLWEGGESTTTLLVTVTTVEPGGPPSYRIYLYIGGPAAGFLLLFAIIIKAILNRRSKRREEYRVKLHPLHRQRWRQWQRK